MTTIALFGATGVLGQSVASALRAQGRRYRVVGRSEASLRREFGDDPLAEIRTWSALQNSASPHERSLSWVNAVHRFP